MLAPIGPSSTPVESHIIWTLGAVTCLLSAQEASDDTLTNVWGDRLTCRGSVI